MINKVIAYNQETRINSFFHRSIWHLENGDVIGFFANFNISVHINNAIVDRFYETALNYIKDQKNLLALAIMKEIIFLNPDKSDYYLTLGKLNLLTGNHPDAIVNLEKSLILDAENAVAWELLGDLLFEVKNYVMALDCYNTAYKKSSFSPEVLKKSLDIYFIIINNLFAGFYDPDGITSDNNVTGAPFVDDNNVHLLRLYLEQVMYVINTVTSRGGQLPEGTSLRANMLLHSFLDLFKTNDDVDGYMQRFRWFAGENRQGLH